MDISFGSRCTPEVLHVDLDNKTPVAAARRLLKHIDAPPDLVDESKETEQAFNFHRKFSIFDYLTHRTQPTKEECPFVADFFFYSKECKIEPLQIQEGSKRPLLFACNTWKQVPVGAYSVFVETCDHPMWRQSGFFTPRLPLMLYTNVKKRKKSQSWLPFLKSFNVLLEYTVEEMMYLENLAALSNPKNGPVLRDITDEEFDAAWNEAEEEEEGARKIVLSSMADAYICRAQKKKLCGALRHWLHWSSTMKIKIRESKFDETSKLLRKIRISKSAISTWRSNLPKFTQAVHKWKRISAGIFEQTALCLRSGVHPSLALGNPCGALLAYESRDLWLKKVSFDLRFCFPYMTPGTRGLVPGMAVARWHIAHASRSFWSRMRKRLDAVSKLQAREDARATLSNEREAEKRARIRAEAKKKAASATEKPFTASGPSGPLTRVTWAECAAGVSEECRRLAQKKIDREKIHMANEEKKKQKEKMRQEEREKERNVQIAFEINHYD